MNTTTWTTTWSTEHLVGLPYLIDGDMALLDRQAREQYGLDITTIRATYLVTPDGDLITETGALYKAPK